MVLAHALHLRSLTSKAGCFVGRQAAAEEDTDINNIDTGSTLKGCLPTPSSGLLMVVSPIPSPQHYGIRSDPVGMHMIPIIDVTHGKSILI